MCICLASLTRVFFNDDLTNFDDVQRVVLEREGDVRWRWFCGDIVATGAFRLWTHIGPERSVRRTTGRTAAQRVPVEVQRRARQTGYDQGGWKQDEYSTRTDRRAGHAV